MRSDTPCLDKIVALAQVRGYERVERGRLEQVRPSSRLLDPADHEFFHGTTHEFRPGDLVETGHTQQFSATDPRFTYFTRDLDDATNYARRTNSVRGTGIRGKAHVYAVEPVGKYQDDPDHWRRDVAFRSRQPLRVIGEVRQPAKTRYDE